MNSLLSALRAIESKQTWRSERTRLQSLLQNHWAVSDWLCQLSCLDVLGESDQLRAEIEAVPKAQYSTSPEAYALRHYMHGRLCQSLGEYGQALKCYMQAAAANPTGHTRALLALQTGTINKLGGRPEDAKLAMIRTLEEAASVADYHSGAHASDYLVSLAIATGDLADAADWLKHGKELASRVSNEYRAAWLMFSEGELEWARGSREHAVELMRRVRNGFVEVGAVSAEVHASSRLALRLQEMDLWDESLELLQRADELARNLYYNAARSAILQGFAALARRGGDLDTALNLEKRSEFIKLRAGRRIDDAGDPHVFSYGEISRMLRTLTPEHFEILCVHILREDGWDCQREPLNNPDFDIRAEKIVRVTSSHKERITMRISCKRFFGHNVNKNHVPDVTSLERGDGKSSERLGIGIMTTGKISGPADLKLGRLRDHGVLTEVWDGDRIVDFLASEDHVLGVVMRAT